MNRLGASVTIAMLLSLSTASLRANNLQITNVTVMGRNETCARVKFDISWENSWRYTNLNHDAAWLFFKVLPDDRSEWEHVTLEGTGSNPDGYDAGVGTPIEMIVPVDRMGLFVRRSGEGAGTILVTNVQAVWNFAANGLVKTDTVKVQAFAVEMVYVAEGGFKVGSGGTEANRFYAGGTANDPFEITSESDIAVADSAGSLYYRNDGGGIPGDRAGPVLAAFPKGYAAFYCMKYEITQGQYKDFLNALTASQASNRNPGNFNSMRMRITGAYPAFTTDAPDRACNYLAWTDVAAFADWSGLRPMTELEFEKACRGPMEPTPSEYVWGNTTLPTAITSETSDGSGASTANPSGANICYNGNLQGPCRAGIFAKAGSTREQAGASYWGIMELSGNVQERIVTVGHATGRNFTGLHGDGVLTATGNANVSAWPGTTATGAGFRGGRWNGGDDIRISERMYAAQASEIRQNNTGGRGVRSAPSGVDP